MTGRGGETPDNRKPDIKFERIWCMPSKNTFSIKPIRKLIAEEKTDGTWVDPFANRSRIAELTNDLNPVFDTDYHIDALDFLKIFSDESVDGVLYDPPYSPRQVSECYQGFGMTVTQKTTQTTFWSLQKSEIARITKLGGKVISFGWNSMGIGIKRGFMLKRLLLVPHGGGRNDTICTVEIKIKRVPYEGKQKRIQKDDRTISLF